MSLRPAFTPADRNKILINIGCLFDIPTGKFVKGQHGENILLGGLGMATGMVGIGNNFKSTIMHYMMLSAYSRIAYTTESSMATLDTEINMDQDRLYSLTQGIPLLRGQDVIDTGAWVITDATKHTGTEWYKIYKDFIKLKTENVKQYTVTTPFLEKDGTLRKIIIPTFGQVDSLTKFQYDDIDEKQDKTSIGDKDQKTIYMQSGWGKARFLSEQPRLLGSSNHYLLLSAHVGKDIVIPTGPGPSQQKKQLTEIKNGDKVKGTTDDFFFLTSNIWQAYNAAPFINQTTKGPEYPKTPKHVVEGDKDLYQVYVKLARSKHGKTGPTFTIIVSQTEGVLAELTEFNYLKNDCSKFGISGNDRNYHLDLRPDVNLMRTTVRERIDNDPALRRAITITSEMAQMYEHWHYLMPEFIVTPKRLYDDIKELGYDWDYILNHTRGWWTINNDDTPLKFLSTMDLLCMRLPKEHPDHYVPYWLKKDLT